MFPVPTVPSVSTVTSVFHVPSVHSVITDPAVHISCLTRVAAPSVVDLKVLECNHTTTGPCFHSSLFKVAFERDFFCKICFLENIGE